jgi:hypothetical protein
MNNNNGIVCSSRSTYQLKWEVTNKLNYPIRLRWINEEGKCINEGFVIEPEKTSYWTSSVGHMFIVTNEKATSPKDSFVNVISVMGSHTIIS